MSDNISYPVCVGFESAQSTWYYVLGSIFSQLGSFDAMIRNDKLCKLPFLCFLLMVIFPEVSVAFQGADGSASPNIILIMTDDQGYWDTRVTGNPHIDTPYMDQLATTG